MTHRHAIGLATAAALAAALAGCATPVVKGTSSASGPTLPSSTSAASSSPTAAPGPPTSARGTIVKALGQTAGIGADAQHLQVTFTVDAIAPARCDNPYGGGEKPTGTLIAAHLRLSTAAGTAPALTMVNPADFEFVGADGITHAGTEIADAATYGCLKAPEQFPETQFAPGSSYVGDVVLDVPSPHGALIFAPAGLTDASGWEWDF